MHFMQVHHLSPIILSGGHLTQKVRHGHLHLHHTLERSNSSGNGTLLYSDLSYSSVAGYY